MRKHSLLSIREAVGLAAVLVLTSFRPLRASAAAPPLRLFDDAKKQPAAFHIGLDYLPDNSVTISTRGTRQKDGLGEMRAGIEYGGLREFLPRLGYQPDEDSALASGLVAGVRMKMFGEQFVYAFAPFRNGGTAHYLSFTRRFG